MTEETKMSRSVFNSIREHQQIDKYDTENTYQIILSSRDGDGTSVYDYKNFIQPIGKEHIKNARVRVKMLDFAGDTANNTQAVGFVRCGLANNTIIHGSRTSGIIGGFFLKEVLKNEVLINAVPPLSTLGAVAIGPAGALQASVASNTSVYFDTDAGAKAGMLSNETGAISNVSQATYNIREYNPVIRGLVGIPVNSTWVSCENPFGKDVDIKLVGGDLTDTLEPAGAGGETNILLEVQLLPDNQANDKFSY